MATRVSFPFTQKQAMSALISLIENGELCYTDVAKNGDKSVVKPSPDKIVEWLAYKIEQNDKKSDAPRKLTPAQEANLKTMDAMLANMEVGKRYIISDMLMTFDCFEPTTSPQRVSALLSKLGAKGTGQVVRTEEKGKAYFSLA